MLNFFAEKFYFFSYYFLEFWLRTFKEVFFTRSGRKHLQAGFIKLTRRTLTTYLIVSTLFFGTGLIYLFGPWTGNTEAAWFNEDWGYRKAITVTVASSASDISNLETLLTVDTSAISTKLQGACQDLRFTSVSGKLLPYYIDSGCTTSTAKIWVMADLVPKNTTTYTMYMYYGNPAAPAGTNSAIFDNVVGLIAYWALNDGGSSATAADSSVTGNTGNLSIAGTGTQTTATQAWTNGATGKYGGSINLDGTDDEITTTTQYVNPQTFTLEAWFKTSVASGNKIIAFESAQTGTGAGNYDRHIWMGTDGKIRFGVYNGSFNILTSASTYTDNNWHHVVANHDGSNNMALYIDGSLIDSGNASINNYTGYWRIGAYETDGGWLLSADGYFDGQIDDVRIYNTARTAAQIAADYTNSSCGGQTCTIATTSNSTSTPSTSFASEEPAPAPVAYWKFDDGTGTNAQDATTNNKDITLAASTATPAWQTEDQCISGKCLYFDGSNDYASSDLTTLNLNGAFTIGFWMNSQTTGTGVIWESTSASAPSFQAAGSGTYQFWMNNNDKVEAINVINPYTWNYVVATYDGPSQVLYVNGIRVGGNTSISSDTITTLYLGSRTGSSSFWKGKMDEFKVYNTARSAAQVLADYNARSNPMGAAAQVGLPQGNNPAALSNGLVGYWKMEEAGDATRADSSGNGNTLAESASDTIAQATGKFGYGGDFELGDTEYLFVADSTSLSVTGSLTVSAWIKPETVSAGSYNILGKWDGSNESYRLFQNGDEIRLELDAAGNYQETTASNLAAGTWYHVVGVYDSRSATAQIYINGALAPSTTTGTIPSSIGDDAGRFQMGAEDTTGGATGYYDGIIDEARIYNRALSSAEVTQLYNFAPGPTGYWKMDENTGTTINDSSGNANTGTFSGAGKGWGAGKYGAAGTFDGSNAIVDIGNSSSIGGMKNITVEAWFYKTPVQTVSSNIVSKTSGADNITYLINFDGTSSNIRFFAGSNTPGGYDFATTAAPSNNAWHHVAGVDDGTKVYIYIDGVLKNSTVKINGAMINGANDACIGGYSDAGNCNVANKWSGKIDEVKIYDYARTQGQIIEDMNAGHPAPGSPIGTPLGWWKFEEGYSATAHNSGSQGALLDGALLNMATAPSTSTSGWSMAGKFGKALSFDATNDAVDGGTDTSIDDLTTGPMTVSAWIYPITIGEGSQGVIISKNDGVSANQGWIWQLTSTRNLKFSVGGSTDLVVTSSGDPLALNAWNHVALTWDGVFTTANSVHMYVNDQEVSYGTQTNGASIISDAANSIRMGNDPTGASTFDGKIDEMKIYKQQLTLAQIGLDMNRGSAQVLGSLSNTNNTSDQVNAASQEYCVPGDTGTTCTKPVGRWDFEEGTGTTANDSSSNSNTATLAGSTATPLWAPGKYGKGLSFDGSNDDVAVANESNFDFERTDSFSVSAWIKPNTTRSGSPEYAIASKLNSASPFNGWEFMTIYNGPQAANKNVLKLNLINDVSTNKLEIHGTTDLSNNTWYYVTMTYAGTSAASGVKFYINGVPETTTTAASTLSATILNNISVHIGSRNNSNTYYKGTIDNLRVYNYVRTPAQVAWEYNKGGPAAWWKMDDCQGTTLNDSSGNNRPATYTAGASTLGTCTTASSAWDNTAGSSLNNAPRNYALNFDGTDDAATVDLTSLNLTAFSFSVWAKFNSISSGVIVEQNASGDSPSMRVSSNNLEFWVHSSDKVSYAVATGTWYHFVGTYDGSSVSTLYVNGIPVGTKSGLSPDTITTLNIGKRAWGGDSLFLNGRLDDLRVYDYALTATQVKSLTNDGATRFGPVSGAP